MSTKNTKKLPSKGAEYSPDALVPHKSMCNKFAYNSHRRSRNPRKVFSHPFIPFSHKFIIAYQSPRLSIDSLNLVCARTRHIPTTYKMRVQHVCGKLLPRMRWRIDANDVSTAIPMFQDARTLD